MPSVHLRNVLAPFVLTCLACLALAGSASALTFAPAISVPQAQKPYSVISKDFNGDGFADLASANLYANTVSIQLGDGNGGFTPAGNFPAGSNPFAVASGDFNGDGFLDLATANYSSDDVSILPGDGTGSFGPPVSFSVYSGANPYSVVAADFNGDGILDLATANQIGDTASVLLGDGTGGFGPASTFAVGDNPHRVASADFDGDGKADLVTSNADSGDLTVLLGDGSGGFGPATTLPLGANVWPLSVITTDFNGDGFTDLATANIANHVSVLLGDGTGGFGPPVQYPAFSGLYVTELISGDFDGDGKVDIAAVNIAQNSLAVLLGTGSGTFGTSIQVPVGVAPQTLTSADFNGDGLPDIATASVDGHSLGYSILLNTSPPPPKADVAITKTAAPTDARPGDTVTYTLKAKNVGNAVANDVVVTDSLPAGLSFVSADAPCLDTGAE